MSRVYGVTVWGLEFALCFGCWLKGSGFLWVFREFKAPGVLGVQAVAFRVQGRLGFRVQGFFGTHDGFALDEF